MSNLVENKEEIALYPVKCAWCKKIIRYSTEQHSHGICKKCKEEMLKELE